VKGDAQDVGVQPRSWLFVPGDQSAKIGKALSTVADAVVIDLEDAVHPSSRHDARGIANDALSSLPVDEALPSVYVRISRDPGFLEADLDAVLHPCLSGLVLPKVSGGVEISEVIDAVERREPHAGLIIIAMVETAAAVMRMQDLVSAPGLGQLMMGEQDLSADLGLPLGIDEAILGPIRLQAVVASAAVGLASPVASPHVAISDGDGLRRSSLVLAKSGFSGRAVIHPSQVQAVNEAFSPSVEEIDRARRVLDTFSHQAASGVGAYAGAGGQMVDEAVVRRARSTIARARPVRPEA